MTVKYDALIDDLRIDDTNFSYDIITTPITIEANQQMTVHEELVLDSEIILNGRIFLNE
jgi:hypothetical protein